MTKEQAAKAKQFGIDAYNNGEHGAPALNAAFLKWAYTEFGTAVGSLIPAMKQYQRGFIGSLLAAPVEN